MFATLAELEAINPSLDCDPIVGNDQELVVRIQEFGLGSMRSFVTI